MTTFSEIFGYSVHNFSAEAEEARKSRICRFKDAPCTKSSKTDPLGICSVSDGELAVSLCPVRFLESDLIFREAAQIAFGSDSTFAVFPEIRILEIPSEVEDARSRKIGKVDFVLGKIVDECVVDFAALEVQASYFSGTESRTALKHFVEHRSFGTHDTFRRPDFRSSAQKRLMPQLQLKVPVFRRWGKKFFVVVDTQFFGSLPKFRRSSHANSEITWLVCPIQKVGQDYLLSDISPVFSQWDDVKDALREGHAPDPQDILVELQAKLKLKGKAAPRLFSVKQT